MTCKLKSLGVTCTDATYHGMHPKKTNGLMDRVVDGQICEKENTGKY